MSVSRRGVLIGSLAGGGLLLGYLLRPREFPLPLTPRRGEAAFGAWIRIARDGIVTVSVPQLEMGQGVTTLIAQVIAEELGADWRRVAVEPVPADANFANTVLAARWSPLWMPTFAGLASAPDSSIARRWAEDTRFMATADGTAIAAYEEPCRIAAASTRAMLAMAAADRWDAEWEECKVANGLVTLGSRRLRFGELATDAAAYDPPSTPPLRTPVARERPVAGSTPQLPRFPRLDLPSKANGSHVFAGDVRLPDMVYAAIRHGPIGDGLLSRFNREAPRAVEGFLRIVRHERWLAAVASNWWAAEGALTAANPTFKVRNRPDSTRIEDVLDTALRKGEATRLHEIGDVVGAFAKRPSLAMRYDVAPALHATLETASATARLSSGRLELWVASQAPEAARRAAAGALGLDPRDVILYPMPAGGSFDRRLEHDHAVEAAIIAREIGKPVQLTWSRWQEHLAGLPRAPAAALMSARTTAEGDIVGWRCRIAVQASGNEFGRRLFGGDAAITAAQASALESDPMAMEGALPPYAIPAMAIDHVPAATGLPAGRMRGNAHAYTAFFTESFIDELARKARREPLSYRIGMLSGDLRLAACLQRCAALAQWDAGADASGQGLACHIIGDGRIAVIATARRDERGVRVDKIHAVVDIGRIVNLDIARQQIEGGLVFGLGLALGSSISYAEGIPATSRLGALGLPLLADCPEIAVEFIDSLADPADPGELGVAAAPPAIANALFSATGVRFRRLPLLGEDI